MLFLNTREPRAIGVIAHLSFIAHLSYPCLDSGAHFAHTNIDNITRLAVSLWCLEDQGPYLELELAAKRGGWMSDPAVRIVN